MGSRRHMGTNPHLDSSTTSLDNISDSWVWPLASPQTSLHPHLLKSVLTRRGRRGCWRHRPCPSPSTPGSCPTAWQCCPVRLVNIQPQTRTFIYWLLSNLTPALQQGITCFNPQPYAATCKWSWVHPTTARFLPITMLAEWVSEWITE